MPNLFNKRNISAVSSLALLLMMGEPGSQGATMQTQEFALGDLRKGQKVSGFRTEALYLNDADKAFGARFKHEKSGFTFDLLQIQSVPQAFIWTNTLLNTDSGVAHTQEHLLLGKGNKGRNHGTRVSMALVDESAGTAQWRTFYHFNTSAGADVFYKLWEQYLDLLLNPDYTDEEIRREVANFAVKEDSKTKSLVLEEKGTVYNEMCSSIRDPNNVLWFAAMKTLYGKGHPLTYINGGSPEGIRKLQPAEIRRFHAKNYVLPNMGMIGAFPKDMPVSQILTRADGILNRLHKRPAISLQALDKAESPPFPQPKPTPAGSIQIVNFPEKNTHKPGTVEFAWPPKLSLNSKDLLLLRLFMNNLAGDADTPLYKVFVDSKTVKIESGATGVSGWVSGDQGFPIVISISDVAQTHINRKDLNKFRALIVAELKKVAQWKDGSAELASFNSKMQYRLDQSRRYYADFVNKPPAFGTRGNSGFLMDQLLTLDRQGGFRRSVTYKPEFVQIEKLLTSKTNIWRNYLAQWHLLDIEPYVLATHPDPGMLAKDESDTKTRLAAETERLKKIYQTSDAQEALRKYKADYDAKTASLEVIANKDPEACKLVDSLPMTNDDKLVYQVSTLPGNVQQVTSIFESMTSSQTTLSLRLDGVASEDLFYISLMPELLRDVGVIENGKAVSYEKMIERLGREIYYLSAYFSSNPNKDRYELRVSASGTNETESKRSIEWMRLILEHPYWRTENLHRIRDVVEQSLTSLRNTRDSGYEENWDYGLAASYRRQDNPLQLNTNSFLTKTHNAQRLRWLLKGDEKPATNKSFADFMTLLAEAGAKTNREGLKTLVTALAKRAEDPTKSISQYAGLSEIYAKLSGTEKNYVSDAADDIAQDLPDIPDQTLKADWECLCKEIAHDVQVPPSKTLEKLDKIRANLLSKSAARLSIVGSESTIKGLSEPISQLVANLDDKPFQPAKYSNERRVNARYRERLPESERADTPEKLDYAGLHNAKSQQGIVINTAPAIKYTDTDDESLKQALSFGLYGGAGAHGLFMKTWGAGLAYGNGPSWSCNSRQMYYADKMPSTPETLKFVAATLKKATPTPDLVEYAIAQCFDSRASNAFETRADSMADDLTDNVTPDTVRNFRSSVLKLRGQNNLIHELFNRMLPQYAKVIPGLGLKAADVKDGCHLAIGDEKQLASYEDYLKSLDGKDTKIHRLWARDFWINSGDMTK